MTLRYSQALCEAQAGRIKAAITATTIALVDGGGSEDTATDSGNGFVSAGFEVGDLVEVLGASDEDNLVVAPVIGVAVGTLTFPTGTWNSGETAGASITMRARERCSFAELARLAQLDIMGGTIPSSPDAAESGSPLVTFSNLKFGPVAWDSTNKRAYVDLIETISATALLSGPATHFRMRLGQAYTTGASTTLKRIDGTVGVSTGDMRITNTEIVAGAPESISSLRIYWPQTQA